MMGQLESNQNSLFYDFCLEKHIPKNHLLRRIHKLLNFQEVRDYLEPFYSHTGRPSIDPELMLRMLLVGYYYSTNYLVDIENNVIVDVEATPSNTTSEIASTKRMINRIDDYYGVTPKRLLGDTAYGTAQMLNWTVDKGIAPYSPVWDKSERKDGTYSVSDFQFDSQANEYICPNNKRLLTSNRPTNAKTLYYYSRVAECKECADKEKCCPKTPQRRIARSVYEEARDIARAIQKTPENRQSQNDRKKVEMLFGHLKRILRFDQLRLRGLSGASDEFLLAATAQNLRKMVKLYGKSPPSTG